MVYVSFFLFLSTSIVSSMSLALPGKFDHIKLSWRTRFPSAFLYYSFSSEIKTPFFNFFWYFFSFLYHQQTASALWGQNLKILFQLFCNNKIAGHAKYKKLFLKTHTDVTVISQHWYVLNSIINLITYCCESFIFLSFFSPFFFFHYYWYYHLNDRANDIFFTRVPSNQVHENIGCRLTQLKDQLVGKHALHTPHSSNNLHVWNNKWKCKHKCCTIKSKRQTTHTHK